VWHCRLLESHRLKSFLNWAKTPFQRVLALLRLRSSKKIAGRKFYFDPATDIGLQLLVTGKFEQSEIEQCANFIRPDGIVIDIGANIGFHTVHFADLARLGKVICFEPARSTFGLLLQNVQHLANVIPLNVALSDSNALQPFFVAADNAYSGLKDTKRTPIVREEFIACFKGDDILSPLLENKRVDLIKIDVEGLELQVLLGMSGLLAAHRPVIFCEIFGGQQSNSDPASTVRFCVSLGYDAFVLSAGQLMPAGPHTDRLYNYFFIPRNLSTEFSKPP
jgi:FkbM family methyltransferase